MIVIVTILLLGIIIFLHEFGHFYMAKMYNMPVSEFSIGMGFLLYKKEYKGTQYSLRAIPIGGYVKIEGMSEDEEYEGKGFFQFSKFEKIVVLLAGVLVNFFTALIVILIYVFIVRGFSLNSIVVAFDMFFKNFTNVFLALKNLFTGATSAKELVGPVGLPKQIALFINQNGFIVLLPIFALLSINIGILNLLPIPALDGGRIIFVLLEYFNIKLNKKIEEKIHLLGMILLLALMVYVLFNDIMRYLN